ncbi:MAG: hypothetical protein HON18_02225, partial [Rhodospirillaceae bacterium]|nr:hypothetical protein [Rhodospirillaceae bacterium]
VEAIRVDGSKVTLTKGDDIFQGDTLVTAKGAAVGITFIDDTTFSLGEEGRMVIDEMVYDADTQEGQFSANLVQGVFSFVSGEIAKTSPDGMTVTTPVATIGIRGTMVAGRAAQEGAENTISLLPETDAQGNQSVGELSVTNQGGTVTLNSIGATVQMSSAFQAPPPPVVFSPQQIQQSFGGALTTLSTTAAAKADADAAKGAEEADQAQAEAEQAQAEAEQAGAEAEAAQAEAEAAQAEAKASGDPEAIAEAEAKAAEAEAKATEAETAQAEAEAASQEAEAKTAQAEQAQAEAEHANNQMQAQSEAFAQFGTPPPGAAPNGDGPPDSEAPPEGDAGPDGQPQDGENNAIDQAAEEAAREAIADGATLEEAAAAGFDAAKEQALAEGATPEEIAAAEQAYNDALAAGASPEEAMQAAGDAAAQLNPNGPDEPSPDGSLPPPGTTPIATTSPDGTLGAPPPDGSPPPDNTFTGTTLDGGGSLDFGGTFDLSGTYDGGIYNTDPTGGSNDPIITYDPLLGTTVTLPGPGDNTNPDDPTTSTNTGDSGTTVTGTFDETPALTTGDDNKTGGSGNTQFIMTQGTTLGGTDVLDGAGGTDEIAFKDMTDLWGIYHGGTDIINYSTSNSSISGQVTLTSVEQLYANDGVETFTDATSAGAKTGTNGVRLDISGSQAGYYGYLRAGTDNTGTETISLADTNSSNVNFGTLSHAIDGTKVMGALIFGLGGIDDITGTTGGDVIFGGSGNDIINGGGTGSGDGDIMIGGAGADTFKMITSSLSSSAIVGGSESDELTYGQYGAAISFAITNTSATATHDSNVNDTISGVEILRGAAGQTNTYTFSGDTTTQGFTEFYGNTGVDTFTFNAGSTVSADIYGVSQNDIFNIAAGASITSSTFTAGGGDNVFNISYGASISNGINAGGGTDTVNLSGSGSFDWATMGFSLSEIVTVASGTTLDITATSADALTSITNSGTVAVSAWGLATDLSTISGGTITADWAGSGTFTGNLGSSTLTNIGTLTSSTGVITGTINNTTGTINLTGDTNNASLTLNNSAGGTLNFSAANADTAGTTIGTMADNAGIIDYATALTSYRALTVNTFTTNSGTINMASHASWSSYLNITSGTLTNSGTITTAASNTGAHIRGDLTSSGILTFNGDAYFDKAGATYINSGTLSIAASKTLFVQGASTTLNIQSGSTLNNSGTIQVDTGSTLTLGYAYTNANAINLNAGNLTLSGTLTNTGTLTSSTGAITGTINNTTGTINLTGDTTNASLTLNNAAGGTLNFSAATVDTAGTTIGTMTNNAGTIDFATALTSYRALTVDTFTTNSGTINMASHASWASYLNITNGTLTNTGTITTAASNTGAHIRGNLTSSGTLTFNGNTYFDKAGAAYINSGTLAIAATKTLFVQGASTTLTNQAGGTIEGTGTLDVSAATFTNAGTIDAATTSTVGTLAITGGVTFSSGTLKVDVDTAASYDTVTVSGALDLSSSGDTLNLDFTSYGPTDNDSLTVLTASSLTGGAFDTVTHNLASGWGVSVTQGTSTVVSVQNTSTSLDGTAGADYMVGGSGADNISGGAGADTLSGSGGIDTFTTVTADVAAAGMNSVAYDILKDFTSGVGGDIFNWNTDYSNQGNTISASAADEAIGTGLSDGILVSNANTYGFYEITSATNLGNDIIIGSNTSSEIEGWAATMLNTVDHSTGDNVIFALYDDGTITSTVAFLEFTADATLTDMVAAEFQLIAVADIAADSLLANNFA